MFQPALDKTLAIQGHRYRFAPHPTAPGQVYAQQGRAATVYQISADGASEPWRTMLQGPDGTVYRLSDDVTVQVGRAHHVAILTRDVSVSPVHASMSIRGGRLLVCDHGSVAGTFIDEVRIAPETWTELADEGAVTCGKFRLERSRFVQPEEPLPSLAALKVFNPSFRVPALVGLSARLRAWSDVPGLLASWRWILTPQYDAGLLLDEPHLVYAAVMPWLQGTIWIEQILERQAMTFDDGFSAARSLVSILAGLEQRGVAHCDLSGSNVLLTPAGTVELVDLEQVFAPGLECPAILSRGSPGYAHPAARAHGFWSLEADRFAGAVLVAEMLGWPDDRVREASWDESYFRPDEPGRDCARYRVMQTALREQYGDPVAGLLETAWSSPSLGHCPTFGEWAIALLQCVRQREQAPATPRPAPARASVAPRQTHSGLRIVPYQAPSRGDDRLERAAQCLRKGDEGGARALYLALRADSPPDFHAEIAPMLERLPAPAPEPEPVVAPDAWSAPPTVVPGLSAPPVAEPTAPAVVAQTAVRSVPPRRLPRWLVAASLAGGAAFLLWARVPTTTPNTQRPILPQPAMTPTPASRLAPPPPVAPTLETATLDLHVQPIGATLWVDGQTMELRLEDQSRWTLPSGKHVVEIKRLGFQPYRAAVRLETGQTDTLAVRLLALASLKVSSTPSGATVQVAGYRGVTPLTLAGLTAQQATVIIEKPGYQRVTRRVTLHSSLVTLHVPLVPVLAPRPVYRTVVRTPVAAPRPHAAPPPPRPHPAAPVHAHDL